MLVKKLVGSDDYVGDLDKRIFTTDYALKIYGSPVS